MAPGPGAAKIAQRGVLTMAQAKVFVSYSQPDHDVAHELVARVETSGIECWIAPRNILPGESWPAAIIGAINNAQVMVLVFSAAANKSPQVSREVERAANRGVRVLAFRIADVVPTADLEFFLSSRSWLNAFPPPLEQHYAALCTCLNALMATPTNPPLREEEMRWHADLPPRPPEPRPPEPRPSPVRPHLVIEPANLRRLESELSFYIGPIAGYVVSCATADAQNVDTLLQQLGGEIRSEPQRRKFIHTCQQWLHTAGSAH